MTKPRSLFGLLLALSLGSATEARTLTAADGRVIEADVLGFEGSDKVKIKRADTGQTFTLPISSFSETDRAALLEEARVEAAKPPPPPATGEIVVELSRKLKNGITTKAPVTLMVSGQTRQQVGEVKVTEVDAAYSITVVNRSRRTFEKLRIDYVLFSELVPRGNIRPAKTINQKTGRINLEPIAANSRLAVSTDSIATRKTDLDGRAYWTLDNLPIDLKGIWLRIYQGDQLVMETATPESLASGAKWPDIQTGSPTPGLGTHP